MSTPASSRKLKSERGSPNTCGSLRVSEEELAGAFEFFDLEGNGKITAANLKQRLGAFYKNLPVCACPLSSSKDATTDVCRVKL